MAPSLWPQEPVSDYFPEDDLFTPLERHKGLPIGNQTSQFFANVYLDRLDHFIKEELHCRAYLRYMDDFLLFHDSAAFLREARCEICKFLGKDRLKLHPTKQVIGPTEKGITFLGYRVFPDHRRVKRDSTVRFCRKMRCLQRRWEAGRTTLQEIGQTVAGWIGHVQHADTWGLRRAVLSRFRFKRPAHCHAGAFRQAEANRRRC